MVRRLGQLRLKPGMPEGREIAVGQILRLAPLIEAADFQNLSTDRFQRGRCLQLRLDRRLLRFRLRGCRQPGEQCIKFVNAERLFRLLRFSRIVILVRLDLLQRRYQAVHDLRMLGVEIPGLAQIGVQVVELGRRGAGSGPCATKELAVTTLPMPDHEFPLAAAHRELPRAPAAEDYRPLRVEQFLSQQRWQHVVTVGAGALRKLLPKNGRKGCQHVGRRDKLHRSLPRFGPVRPARDEGHPVPPFGKGSLAATKRSVRVVTVVISPGAAIITGEDHQGVLRQTQSVQCAEHFTHRPVQFLHEVAIASRLAGAVEARMRLVRDVRLMRRVIEEEWLILLRKPLQFGNRLAGQRVDQLLILPAGALTALHLAHVA